MRLGLKQKTNVTGAFMSYALEYIIDQNKHCNEHT